MILAFQAGSINVGGFMACHKFVTHTTGFATAFGAELAMGALPAALGMATVPIFFLAGAMISAIFVDRQLALMRPARYNLLFMMIVVFMLFVTFLGVSGALGKFGDPYGGWADYTLLALLCLTSGIQNAAVTSATSASSSAIRTTHLTGITTDLGIGIVRVLSKGFSNAVKETEWRTNITRMGLIGFFILGSTLGAFIFIQSNFWGFLVPAFTAFVTMITAQPQKPHRKV